MEDIALIESIRKGDQQALSKLYEEHRKDFSLWLIKHYGSAMDDALEVYQETIIAFYENVVSGKLSELSSSIKTYLFSIGKNKYLSMTRKSGRNVNSDAHLQMVTDDGSELEEKKVKEDMLTLVEASFKKLSEHCRKLLKFFYYDRLSMEDIMDKLKYKNANTAKNQKYKCMQQLRKFHSDETS